MNERMRPGMKKREWAGLAVFCAVFAVMFVFFFSVHPLLLFDSDDWLYVSNARSAYPLWGNWNPTRVLPENLMSGASTLGVILLMPLTGDYFSAISLTAAFLVSLSIAIYVYMFYRLLRRRYGVGAGPSALTAALFLLAHFLIFRNNAYANDYLFHSMNLTNYYFYMIPSLWVFSLIMGLTVRDATELPWDGQHPVRRGFLILLIYLLLLSNLYPSGALAVWFFCAVVRDGIKRRGESGFLKRNAVKLGGLLLWGIALVFEANGGRAGSLASAEPLPERVLSALGSALTKLSGVNLFFLIFCALCLIGFFLTAFRRKEKETVKFFFFHLIVGVLCFGYIVLLCAWTGPANAAAADIQFNFLFFFLLLMFTGLGAAVAQYPRTAAALPLILCLLLFETNTRWRTFVESNSYNNIHPSMIRRIDGDILSQITAADQAGKTCVTVRVPEFDTGNNWPLPLYAGERMSMTLYKHGMTVKQMEITLQPDGTLNETYHLPAP